MRIMLIASTVGLAAAPGAFADIRITEWMYSGNTSEFIEFTNVGPTAIDVTGWSFDDDSRIAGTVSLSSVGIVNPGESFLLIEGPDAAAFRTAWGLAATVDIVAGNLANLSRNDEINIYDASSTLIDRLAYGDQAFAGTIRTQNISGWTNPANLGANTVAAWVLSAAGDGQSSWTSAQGDIGNPGTYSVPVPGALALLGLAGVIGAGGRRRA